MTDRGRSGTSPHRPPRQRTIVWWLGLGVSYALAGLTLLLPALINRYPLFIGDTWRYLRETQGEYHWVSSQFYSYLIEPLATWSLWVIVAFQAVLAVVVLAIFLRRVSAISHGRAALIIGLLGLASSLGFFVSGIMTDLMFGLGLIASATLMLSEGSVASDVIQVAVVTYAAAAHPAALPILGFLALLALVVALVRRWRDGRWSVHDRAAKLVAAVGLAVVALTINNAVVWDKATPNPHSSVVTFAYLLGSGDLYDELAECEKWDACVLEGIGRFDLNQFNTFLFSPTSALNQDLGGPTEFTQEANSIVFEHIRTDPGPFVQRVLSSAWDQVTTVEVYGHVRAQTERTNPNHVELLDQYFPGQSESWVSSLQYNKELALEWYSRLGVVVGAVGGATTVLGGLAWILHRFLGIPQLPSRVDRAIRVSLVLAGLYLLHALVIGAATFPTHRYGGRVLWLLALAFWIMVFSLLPEKKERNG